MIVYTLFTVAYEDQKWIGKLSQILHVKDNNITKPNVVHVHCHYSFSACPSICVAPS
jgi:hypothetical protein